MKSSLLTPEDHQWLAKQAEAVRCSLNFMLAAMFNPQSARTISCAREVIILHNGVFIKAPDMLGQIEKEVPYSQIYERWQASVYDAVLRVCRSLSKLDEKALLIVAGFDTVTEEEIYNCAGEAIREARSALYGDDSEHN
ncbi:hypothetical protein GIW05_01230 [Pseudomonas syringae]|uniref:hypothetical protein n=1 Tax=Pseudomonas syringae TaxID=317 RepID=UPI001F2B4634|nr:hypothetical protein [Pseudomonas syringae]MCF5382145.1 hypothetical protein [Pseudomonas syringae]MCF5423522.1 hypothetical protein [Pseudomonas syringae]MCF5455206.1 hypothetical protein [Pseudomonas syringae]MCF5460414.1 hypothetical protein [Pseudomonas syringae]